MIDVNAYIKNPVNCPFCGSKDLETEGAEPTGLTTVMDRVTCNNCEASWRDNYTLTSMEVLDYPEDYDDTEKA